MKSSLSQREFIGTLAVGGALAGVEIRSQKKTTSIDRFALVNRHNPSLRKIEPLSPLSVGNGEFAFTCDVTGWQTFPQEHEKQMPLCTMAQWGWHIAPNAKNYKESDLRLTEFDTQSKISSQTKNHAEIQHLPEARINALKNWKGASFYRSI